MSGAYRDLEDLPSSNYLAATQTVLAWRRVALQVGVGAVVAARLLSQEVGPWVVVAALLGIAGAVAVHASASAAHARGVEPGGGHVSSRGKARIADPRIRLGVMAGVAVAIALAALAWIVTEGLA